MWSEPWAVVRSKNCLATIGHRDSFDPGTEEFGPTTSRVEAPFDWKEASDSYFQSYGSRPKSVSNCSRTDYVAPLHEPAELPGAEAKPKR
jgi:hypothetical protein